MITKEYLQGISRREKRLLKRDLKTLRRRIKKSTSFSGMCGIISDFSIEKKRIRLFNFLVYHRHVYSYWWTMGEKQPRINWITMHLKEF